MHLRSLERFDFDSVLLEPVHARQHHIEHDDVHRGLADGVQRRLTGFGEVRLVAETTQSQFQALPGSRIILD